MSNYRLLAGILLLPTLAGCYLPLSGKVIDADTKQPIEGAVVVVQWTMPQGDRAGSGTVYKIAERATGKNGEFSLPGAYSLTVDDPSLVIYKQGYVAWNKDVVLLFTKNGNGGYETTLERRRDYDGWQRGYVYALEPFKDGYSHDLNAFLMGDFAGASIETTPLYDAALQQERAAADPDWEKLRSKFHVH